MSLNNVDIEGGVSDVYHHHHHGYYDDDDDGGDNEHVYTKTIPHRRRFEMPYVRFLMVVLLMSANWVCYAGKSIFFFYLLLIRFHNKI